jgi:hypothetical protein
MHAGIQPLFVMQQDCDSVVANVSAALKSAGYFVLQSFNLQSSMTAQASCSCGQDSCTCQMVVLLIYAEEGPPVTLIFDSNQTQTSLYLVNSPNQPLQHGWNEKLFQLIPKTILSTGVVTPMVE